MTPSPDERRAYRRFDLICPVVVTDSAGNELLRTKTLNLSDGGALLTMPTEQTIPLGQPVHIDMHLGRSTANTFMFENVSTDVNILRHEPMQDHSSVATAMKFTKPMKLGLEA